MLDQMTIKKLHELRLSAMADSFRDQIQDQALTGLTFEERFGLIVDIEWAKRKNNRLSRLIKNAGFSDRNACIENVEYTTDRKLDKTQISMLSTCNYIQDSTILSYWERPALGNPISAAPLGWPPVATSLE
jgi:hypothetical protein